MPGSIGMVSQMALSGWAMHPVHADYPVLVHALVQGRVVASVLADLPRDDVGYGFLLRLPKPAPVEHMEVLIGETDEYLAPPVPPPPRRVLSVEDLIATRLARPWVNGACHLDATRAGLRPETIIDLLCRDYLGHAANKVVLHAALARLRQGGGYDDVRRSFLGSSQYGSRQVYAQYAAGSIFSQRMVLSVAARDFVPESNESVSLIKVSARGLIKLDGEEFLTACYRQLLRKELDREGLNYYMQKLRSAMSKLELVRHLANEFDAVNAGVVLVD